MIDRTAAVTELVGELLNADPEALVVTGLGTAANDVAALTGQGENVFAMDGVMGAAVSVGLGLALAQPGRRVVVVTGDGELLMNVGALATVAAQRPANLAIACLDNGRYGLTGGQLSHTALGTDLEAMARGAGFEHTAGVDDSAQLATGRAVLTGPGPAFVLVKVEAGTTPYPQLERHGEYLRLRFRRALEAHTHR